MKNQSLLYSLVGLVASGTLTGLFLIYRAQSQSPHNNHYTDSVAQNPNCTRTKMSQQQTDQHYIEMMILHHQVAIDMADLALNKSKRPEILQIAQEIKKTQTAEIEEMKNWYKQWYKTEVSVSDHSSMGHSTNAGGCQMMTMKPINLDALKTASEFDKVFIEEMIPHHEDAVKMSEMVLNSDRLELRNSAKAIIQTQSAEIEQMRQWLNTWY